MQQKSAKQNRVFCSCNVFSFYVCIIDRRTSAHKFKCNLQVLQVDRLRAVESHIQLPLSRSQRGNSWQDMLVILDRTCLTRLAPPQPDPIYYPSERVWKHLRSHAAVKKRHVLCFFGFLSEKNLWRDPAEKKKIFENAWKGEMEFYANDTHQSVHVSAFYGCTCLRTRKFSHTTSGSTCPKSFFNRFRDPKGWWD